MRLKPITLIFCALSFCAHAQNAAKAVVFTPQTLFETIDERSNAVKLASLMVDDARQGVEVAKNSTLPDVSASWEVGFLGNGYLTDRDFSGGMTVKNPHFVNNFSLEAVQLIYSGGAVTQGIRLSELKTRLAELSLAENRQQVRFLMLSRLIDLQCLYKRREVIEANIGLAKQVLNLMQVRYEQGVLLQNDITRYNLQVANLELQRDQIDNNIRVVNANIATTLNYPSETQFSLTLNTIDETYALPHEQQWQSNANFSNLGVKKAQVGVELSQAQLKLAEAERLPKVGAFIYGQLSSPIVTEVPVINKNMMFWGFGVNVSYSISTLFKTPKKLVQAKIATATSAQQLTLAGEGVRNEVKRAYEDFLMAQSQLRTQRYSLTLAEQNYSIVSDRFGEGMALVTDLVDAANVKIDAQTNVENAKSRLQFCLYQLKYITNTL